MLLPQQPIATTDSIIMLCTHTSHVYQSFLMTNNSEQKLQELDGVHRYNYAYTENPSMLLMVSLFCYHLSWLSLGEGLQRTWLPQDKQKLDTVGSDSWSMHG